MREAVKEELRRTYHRHREATFREETRVFWADGNMPYLQDPTTVPQLSGHVLTPFCNKPTTLYWLEAGGWEPRTRVVSAVFYKQWFHCHDYKPNIEYGHYFANPVHVTAARSTTVSGLLQIHAALYAQATSLLARVRSGEIARVDSSRGIVWPDPEHHRLIPLCQAIIVVLDRLSTGEFVNIRAEGHTLTVLLILTGDTSGLSAPISFESVEAECLPLGYNELQVDGDISLVRVSVATAVKFIADLERREEAAYPDTRDHPLEKWLCPKRYYTYIPRSHSRTDFDYAYLSEDEFVEAAMQSADENGIDAVRYTFQAVRRIKAEERKEI